MCRTGSISIPETMRYLRLGRLPRIPLVLPSPIQRSTFVSIPTSWCIHNSYINPSSIPHASPNPVSNSSNPHISVQISPVNSPTSPAKESSLSQESTLADIMSTDPSPPDTTVETKSTTVTKSPLKSPILAMSPPRIPQKPVPKSRVLVLVTRMSRWISYLEEGYASVVRKTSVGQSNRCA
jgi:hypothetical protein